MSLKIAAFLDIEPVGKARPRVTRRGTFVPKKYVAWKEELRRQFGLVWVPDEWVVQLDLCAFVRMPKSWSNKKREAMHGLPARTLPDTDNLAGSVMDAIFLEDRPVSSLLVSRRWGRSGALAIDIDLGVQSHPGYHLYPTLVDRPGYENLIVHVPAESELDARVRAIYAALKLDGAQTTRDVYETVAQYPLYGSAVIAEEG